MGTLSVNQIVWEHKNTIDDPELRQNSTKSVAGATIVDAGVNTLGGFQSRKKVLNFACAGKLV